MVPLFTGHLSASQGLLPAFKALRSMPTGARGVLVVITDMGEAEMAISEQGLIIGALIRGKNEQGLFALKKIMDWKNGKYAFFEGDEYPNEHIKKTLRMDIVSIIRGAEDAGTADGGAQPSQRVDISSVHNKVIPPGYQAPNQPSYPGAPAQQMQQGGPVMPTGQPGYGQQQEHVQQPAYPQQQFIGQPQTSQAGAPNQLQGVHQSPPAYAQSSSQTMPQPGGAGAYGQSQGYQAPNPSSHSPTSNPLPPQPQSPQSAQVKAPTSGAKAKKRKFASTNFAMDVFDGDAPVAPTPKVGETVEDDLLRNLSDLNRLGPAAPAARPAQAPAASAGPSPGLSQQQGGMMHHHQLPTQQGMVPPAGMLPPSGTFAGIKPANMNQSGVMSPAGMNTQSSMSPPGMAPPGMMQPGMPPTQGMMQAPAAAPSPPSPQSAGLSQPMGQNPSNLGAGNMQNMQNMQQPHAQSSQQQSMRELQRQAVEDEAALMQAISSTTNPVYVRPASLSPNNQLAQNNLLTDQQIRAAQSISGNYQVSDAYTQPAQYAPAQPQPVRQPQQPANQQLPNPTQSQSMQAQPVQPPSQQLNRPSAPSSVSPSGSTSGMDKKNKVNPTKTLLESDLFFVDDGLTGSQDEVQIPGLSGMSDSSISGGYAPSAMSNRETEPAPTPAPDVVPSQLDNMQHPAEAGTTFSQAPSFGPGSAGNASKNAGSAILDAMKKRNLGAQTGENNAVGSIPSPDTPAPHSSAPSANALSQYDQSGGIGTGSSSNISPLSHSGLNQMGMSQPDVYDQQPEAPLAGNYNSPFIESQGSGIGSQAGLPPQPDLGYEERMPSPEIIGGPATSNSSTFPARGLSQPLDDIPEPQVGSAPSLRKSRGISAPDGASRGRRDDLEPSPGAGSSRIRSGTSSEHRPGLGTFVEKNKMLLIIVGAVLLVLILVGGTIGVLFAMHMIKTH